ncbi:MAG: ChaN family lipoprotein [Gammaproteobacteria bacterium]|nr:ChaN family lipoprotein [Gammaproteobacteria bacterium]
MRKFLLLPACLAWLLAGGCSPTVGSATWPIDWHAQKYQDNPLIGHIWRPQAQSWASPGQLRAAVAKARFVLLGETHDNPDHHRLQAQLLEAMVEAGRRPVLAFEMLELNQQPALTDFLRGDSTDANALARAVDWAESGWPAWSYYEPIAQVALSNNLEIVAADLPAKEVREVAFKGFQALDPARVTELGLEKPLPKSQRKTMREELYISHCKLVPKAALTGMIHAQRTRNAVMAWRLVETSGPAGAVLITGAGHARTDYGVPLNLRNQAPGSSVLSVAMIEVKPGRLEPSDYAAGFNARRLPFDYVLFTPAAGRKDPCVELRIDIESDSI